jgi:hypothetical protein
VAFELARTVDSAAVRKRHRHLPQRLAVGYSLEAIWKQWLLRMLLLLLVIKRASDGLM